MTHQPLALSDPQLRALTDAASMLPQSQRSDFLETIGNLMAGGNDLHRAIRFALSTRGVSIGKDFHFRKEQDNERLHPTVP